MNVTHDVVSVRGKDVRVPVARVEGRVVATIGRFPRIAAIKDEEWYEGGRIDDLERFLRGLSVAGLKADVLSFSGGLGQDTHYEGVLGELDNAAVIDTRDFKKWWDALPQETRKNVRRAAKRDVRVDLVEFSDEIVRGIKAIYDETPIRQGRRFWHYGKDIDTVRRENGTYLERSAFLGAYCNGELIGFMKWVRVGDIARIMQILCRNAHQDKRPIIALIAKAAEVCHQQGYSHLVYGKYTYGNKGDTSVTEFKRRLGFRQLNFPRYHVPLNLRGRISLRLGLHRGLLGVLPGGLLQRLIRWRSWWLSHRGMRTAVAPGEEACEIGKASVSSVASAPNAPELRGREQDPAH